jgi:hypothetical protein
MRPCLSLLFLALATSTAAQTPPTYQPEINTLADRLANDIQQSSTSGPAPKVLVIDFVNQKGNVNPLGEQLANALSDALQVRLAPQDIIAHQLFLQRLHVTGLSPVDLLDSDALQWNAGRAGATLIITGRVFAFAKSTTLQLDLIRLSDSKGLSSTSADLTVSPDARKLLNDPLNWPATPNVALDCGPLQSDAMTAAFSEAGITPPKCTKCSVPPQANPDRDTTWKGIVKLKAVVSEKGRVISAVTTYGDPYGIFQGTEKDVREWRFNPATKDGKPVAVCMRLQVNFRSHR